MHVITTLRALLAAPRRGVVSALMIAVVIAGVVAMHSMSGSPSVHAQPAGAVAADDVRHAGPTEAMPAHAMPAPMAVEPVASTPHDGAAGADCQSGCGSHDAHDMATAMCLMVLVAVLTLVAPPASFLDAVLRPLSLRALVAAPRSRPAAAPSLHALGISRT